MSDIKYERVNPETRAHIGWVKETQGVVDGHGITRSDLTVFSREQLQAMGLNPVTVEAKPSKTLYRNIQDNWESDGYSARIFYVADAIPAAEVAAAEALKVKAQAGALITATGVDWKATREFTGGDPVPQDLKDYCEAVRQASNSIEAALLAAAEVEGATGEDILAVPRVWPEPLEVSV